MAQNVPRIGFWSAVVAIAFFVLWIILTFAFFYAPAWSGIEAYAQSFTSIQMISFIPVLVLAPALLVLMVCIYGIAKQDKKIYGMMGIAFTIVYVTIICVNYYLQLFVVRLNLLHGNLEDLTILAQPNLHSIFFALETLGYGFLCLASVAICPIFTGELASWIRWTLISSALLGILAVIIAPFDQPYLIFAGLGLWTVLFLAALILIAMFFRNVAEGHLLQPPAKSSNLSVSDTITP